MLVRSRAWSYEQTIAYAVTNERLPSNSTIPLMNADGKYLKQLSDDHNGVDFHADFSPGGLVVFPTSKRITIWRELKKVEFNRP